MADRFFPNQMPDFGAEGSEEETSTYSLGRLLSIPQSALFDKLKSAALNAKEAVVRETWALTRKRVKDYTLYTGAMGTALLAFKAYQVTKNENDLRLCSEIIRACDSVSADSGRVSFICGRAAVCALGAVAAMHAGNGRLLNDYLAKFKQIKLPNDLPNELLYGRSGYLWACLFLNKQIGRDAIPSMDMRRIVDDIFEAGRQMGAKEKSPLMYEWHRKKYWGAAHGLAGIMLVLMHVELKPDEAEEIKNTLCYMIKNRFSSGNYLSSEGSESDRLVHWCHGAPGIALTLVKAAEVFGDNEIMQAAMDAGEVVWNRGLLKRVGICHGVSGNAYVFLSLYRLTGDAKYLYRAKAFACFLYERAEKLISEGKMSGGDRPYSLFEGVGGMAYLFLDMIEPSTARFPAFEL